MRVTFKLLFVITGLLTIFGLCAPFFPPLDFINHFRPFLLACSILVLFGSFIPKSTFYKFTGIFVLSINLTLAGISWYFAKPLTITPRAYAGNAALKVVSFNILYKNRQNDKIAEYLNKEDADIILLQEYHEYHSPLVKQLKAKYPYQHVCIKKPYCGLALLSKTPFNNLESLPRSFKTPPVISAEFKIKDAEPVRIIGTHIRWPFKPHQQSWNMEWLTSYTNKVKKPVILLGDFNHTPWSWRLSKFAFETRLKRHATFSKSWPAFSGYSVFLIDHVFSSKEVTNIKTSVGPNLGSDHLPVISKLSIK